MSAIAPASWRIERHERLASTNDRAIEAAEAGAAPGLMVVAAEQTAGRGRSGRPWASPRGNLFASALLPPLPALRGGAAALLAGLAAHDAVAPLLPEPAQLRLKWPNDLLASGAKLGGILTEAGTSREGIDWIVAGIGLNLAAAPAAPGRKVTSVAALGGTVTVEQAAQRLLDALAHRVDAFAVSGMPGLVAAWRGASLPEGTAMSVHRGNAPVTGRYAGLADDGALLLATEGGIARILAGDVFAEA
jgi:BirA family biotin operon repressor/biotin-[acetyl-CoA-carboxylase] ligase